MTDATPEQKADQRADEGTSIPVRVVKNEEPIRVTDRRFWAQDQSAANGGGRGQLFLQAGLC